MPKPLADLVKEGVLSEETLERLGQAWVTNVDELYDRLNAATPGNLAQISKELGIRQESVTGLITYLKPYVSQDKVNDKPKNRPLGARIPPQNDLTRNGLEILAAQLQEFLKVDVKFEIGEETMCGFDHTGQQVASVSYVPNTIVEVNALSDLAEKVKDYLLKQGLFKVENAFRPITRRIPSLNGSECVFVGVNQTGERKLFYLIDNVPKEGRSYYVFSHLLDPLLFTDGARLDLLGTDIANCKKLLRGEFSDAFSLVYVSPDRKRT